MGHSDKSLRTELKKADLFQSVDFETAPVKTILAIQGGGSWSIAAAEAVKVLMPHLLVAGSVEAISGTSGGAVNAALAVKGLNEGRGAEGVSDYLDTFWDKVRQMGSVFSTPRMMSNPFLPAEDRWPNIPQSYIVLADVFKRVNPAVQFSWATAGLKDMIDNTIGDWSSVQTGQTAIYTNSIRENVFTGQETYEVATGKDVDGDAIASSAGLDELGGHIRLKDMMSPLSWLTGNIHRHKDGAYRLNPDLETMLSNHSATDIIVIALHGAGNEVKSRREEKLYTDQIHRDLIGMQLDDGRRVNFHVVQISLPGNGTSRLNTDPEYLDMIKAMGRQQAEAQIANIMESLGSRSSYQPQAHLVQDMVDNRELAYT